MKYVLAVLVVFLIPAVAHAQKNKIVNGSDGSGEIRIGFDEDGNFNPGGGGLGGITEGDNLTNRYRAVTERLKALIMKPLVDSKASINNTIAEHNRIVNERNKVKLEEERLAFRLKRKADYEARQEKKHDRLRNRRDKYLKIKKAQAANK